MLFKAVLKQVDKVARKESSSISLWIDLIYYIVYDLRFDWLATYR